MRSFLLARIAWLPHNNAATSRGDLDFACMGALLDSTPDYNNLFPAIADALAEKHWCVMPHFFMPALVSGLLNELQMHSDLGRLRPAKIGKDALRSRRRDIRGDEILWLDGKSEEQRYYLAIMEQLRVWLNRDLFLGLDELEAHFAHYPPGSGYKKHLDSFQTNNLRRISVVTYLNPDWPSDAGGELLIYQADEVMATVTPEAGTLVCFVSDQIPHEVATTRADRASIAGWFRQRPPI